MGHFQNVARGVVDLRDILYFVSTCGLFLMLSIAALSRDRLSHAREEFRRLRTGTAVIVAGVLMLNLLGGYIRGRLDLTADNLFTLSDGSRDILGELDDIVNLKLFVSDELPQEIQLTLRDVRDLVADLRGAANGQLITEELNPDDDEDAESEASSLGVFPIEFNVLRDDELQVRRGYFGLALTYADQQEVIPVIDRTDDLEFRLVSAIRNMTSPQQPSVAFATGFGAKDATQFGAFRQGISDRYQVNTVNLEPEDGGVPNIDPWVGRHSGGRRTHDPSLACGICCGGAVPECRWCRPHGDGTTRDQPAGPHLHTNQHRPGRHPVGTGSGSHGGVGVRRCIVGTDLSGPAGHV